MIGLVTDSSAQLPVGLVERFGVTVVPVVVTIDGHDHLEGVDLTADAFYERLAAAPGVPEIATSQPSAGAFVDAFEQQVAAGATAIVAVLVGSAYSGAVNSASVAAERVSQRYPGVRVEIVDSATASFGISCALWAAADTVAAGGTVDEVRDAAAARASVTGSVFVIDGTELALRSGRFGDVDLGSAIPVLRSGPEGLASIGEVDSSAAAVELMAADLVARAEQVIVAIGRASRTTDPVTDALIERLDTVSTVVELIEYRVGPSIAVHTGPNTVGGFSFPA